MIPKAHYAKMFGQESDWAKATFYALEGGASLHYSVHNRMRWTGWMLFCIASFSTSFPRFLSLSFHTFLSFHLPLLLQSCISLS